MDERFERLTERVVVAWGKISATATAQQITAGRAAHSAVFAGVLAVARKARVRRRADILKMLAAALHEKGHHVRPVEINRAIRIFHVAECFGSDEAKGLSVRILIALAPLLQRISGKEEWVIRPKIADQARALFARAVNGDLQPDQVVGEVNTLLGRSPRARTRKAKPSPLKQVVLLVAKLAMEDQRKFYDLLHQRFGQAVAVDPAPSVARPAGPPTVKIPDPIVGQPAEVKEPDKGFFAGARRRRAG